jgi:NitT/TauT family transport system permease protein
MRQRGGALPESWPGWAVFAGLLLAWQVLAMALASRFLPTPLVVVRQIWVLATTGHLLEDFGVTLLRASFGFAIAMVLGTAAGLALGRSRLVDRMFLNLVVVGLNLPAIVIAILCFIWLGLTDTALILAVVLNKLPLVISNIRQGVRAFDPAFDEFAEAFRLSRRQRLRLIYLPQLTPYLLTSARSGLSLVWKIVLVFEVLGADSGVGFRMSLFFEFFDMPGILAYTAVFVLLVMALEHLGLGPLERRWLAWRSDPA